MNLCSYLAPLLLSHTFMQSDLTVGIKAPVHVEQAPRRREAVAGSGERWGAGRGGGEVGPGHGGGVVDVQVAEIGACARRGWRWEKSSHVTKKWSLRHDTVLHQALAQP